MLPDAGSQKISSMLRETGLTIAELCAGMASGTQCATVLEKTWKGLFGEQIRLETKLVSEMVPYKMEVCKDVCAKCMSQPKFIQQTGHEAKDLNPCGTDIAVVAIECDDVSRLSSTQRSILDESGKSGASFLQTVAYLEHLPFERRPKIVIAECVSALGKMKQQFQERGTTVVCDKLLDIGNTGCFHELKSARFFLPQSRGRVYGIFKKMSSFGQNAREAVLKQVDERLVFYSLDRSLCHLLSAFFCLVLKLTADSEDLEFCSQM